MNTLSTNTPLWQITGKSATNGTPVRLQLRAETHNDAVQKAETQHKACVHSCRLCHTEAEAEALRLQCVRALHALQFPHHPTLLGGTS